MSSPSSQRQVRTAFADVPASGTWRIDAQRSSLQIGVKVGLLATVTGRFTDVQGEVEIGDGILDSRIEVVVPTRSLTSGSQHWDGVLMRAGLVDVEANPIIAFESTGLRENGDGWLLDGVLMTDRGCLSVAFTLECLSDGVTDRMRFRATGSVASRDAVRLLSQPGVDRLIGKRMTVDLIVEAVRS
jgi:polyisoprenoid-binding protein YceI